MELWGRYLSYELVDFDRQIIVAVGVTISISQMVCCNAVGVMWVSSNVVCPLFFVNSAAKINVSRVSLIHI